MLDLSRVLAGPLCTMLLGDLGADVLKIERPGSGDETRGWGPPFDAAGESAYYLSVNRNKWSLAADLDRVEDAALVRQLAREADVVVENYRPGALARRGLDAATLLAEHPGLIWCTVSGFGPDNSRPGYDFVVQAERGWMAITGEPDGVPMKTGVAVVDLLTGKDAAIAVLAALVARGRRPEPLPPGERHLHVSLSASAAAGLVNVAQNALVGGADARRWGNAHANLVPYQLFQASDRALVVAVGNDAQWQGCARALGAPALGADPRFVTNAGRLAHRAELVHAIAERLATRPAAEWLARLDGEGVPSGVVKGVLEVLAEVGGSPATGMPVSVPGSIRRAPPRLDEHGARLRARGWQAFDAEPTRLAG